MCNRLRESVTAFCKVQLTISERPGVKRGAGAGLAAARAHLLLLLMMLLVLVVQRRHGGVVLHGGAGQRDRHCDELSLSILSNSIADCNFSKGMAVIRNVGLCLIKELRLRNFGEGVVGAISCLH